jgi:c-di-GMP-binding flagellar brake protein YcgR
MNNKRNFFRVNLYNVPVEMLILEVNHQKQAGELFYKGKILDVSGNGIAVILENKIPYEAEEKIVLRIFFTIEKQPFTFEAEVVRVTERTKLETIYAAKYIHASEKEQEKLSSILFKIDAKRKK